MHGAFAMPFEMSERSGDILRMRRYTRLNTAPVPLGPAMNNPPVQTLNAVDIDARIDWYSTYIIITKQVKDVACSKPSLNNLESLKEAA